MPEKRSKRWLRTTPRAGGFDVDGIPRWYPYASPEKKNRKAGSYVPKQQSVAPRVGGLSFHENSTVFLRMGCPFFS
jgi:hypothetical protein